MASNAEIDEERQSEMKSYGISDFSSSSTIPTSRNKFDDLVPFSQLQKDGSILIRDFATFIQAIGKVYYLAANPQVRTGKVKEEFGDKQYRVFYRGQTILYGKNHNEMKPSAYRNGDRSKEVNASISAVLKLPPFNGLKISREAIEGMIQQYGGVSRWIDVVDNIWVALWFACHRAWTASDIAETDKAKMHKHSSMCYVHYERRVPELEKEDKRYAYVVLLGVEEKLELTSPGFYKSQRDELLNLRQALPSQFIRPHAQHGWLVRRRKGSGYVKDLKDMIHGIIKIPLEIALDWLGNSKAFLVDSIFPPPAFDTGWRDLMFRDEVAKQRVFLQRL